MNDLLTIIVPIYNVQDYLEECLDSILDQTEKKFSVILVNDGSTDNSAEICEYYCQRDIRFKYIYQENQGLGPARHTGIRHASTEWVTFVDSDDWIDHRYVELFYKKIEEDTADIIYSDFYISTNGKKTVNYRRSFALKNGVDAKKMIMFADDCSMWRSVYRRTLWTEYNIVMPPMVYEDSAVFGVLLSKSNKIGFIDKPLYYYRKDREGSLMSIGRGDPYNMLNVLRYHMELFSSSKNNGEYDNSVLVYLTRKIANEYRRCKDESFLNEGIKLICKYYPNWEDRFSQNVMTVGSYIPCSVYNRLAIKRNNAQNNYVFTSMIGLMSECIDINDLETIGSNQYRISMVKKEAHKSWKNNLSECKYILFDFLEEINDIFSYNASYLTKSIAFDESFTCNTEMKVIERNSEECWELWKKSVGEFIELSREKQIKLIMMENYLSKRYLKDGQVLEFDNTNQIDCLNYMLGKYYAYVKDNFADVEIVSLKTDCITSESYETLGCKPYYYNNVAYFLLECQVRSIVEGWV